MKKVAVLLAFVMVFALATASFAGSLTGPVVRADVKGGILVVKGADGKDMTFAAKADLLKGIKEGAKVTVVYDTKDNKNTATKVSPAK